MRRRLYETRLRNQAHAEGFGWILSRHRPRPRTRGPRAAADEWQHRLSSEEELGRDRRTGLVLSRTRRLPHRGRGPGHGHRCEDALEFSLQLGAVILSLVAANA